MYIDVHKRKGVGVGFTGNTTKLHTHIFMNVIVYIYKYHALLEHGEKINHLPLVVEMRDFMILITPLKFQWEHVRKSL